MTLLRSSLLIVACTAPFAIAAPASAFSFAVTDGAPGVRELVARKGTRAFVPGADDTATPTLPDPGAAPVPAATLPATPDVPVPTPAPATRNNDALAQCMDTWDAGTHITKSSWKDICKRQLKERDEDMESMSGTGTEKKSKKKH